MNPTALTLLITLLGMPGGSELDPLLAQPNQAEIEAVRADWAARPHDDAGYRVEASGTNAGARLDVVSHLSDGQRHYAMLRYPRNHDPAGSHPALVLLHGSGQGVKLIYLATSDADLPDPALADEFFFVLPSFRGEPVDAGDLGVFLSEGEKEFMNRDVDDVISLLCALETNVPGFDRARVVGRGTSRGGGTGCLLAMRDPRVRRYVGFYGAGDLFLPSVVDDLVHVHENSVPPTNSVSSFAWGAAVDPWLDGDMTLAEARHRLIGASPAWHAALSPDIQLHHGLLDPSVLPDQSQRLADALDALGPAAPSHELFLYPAGGHSVASLDGQEAEVVPFLLAALDWPQSLCTAAPNSVSAKGGVIDWRGSTSIAANDLELRARDLPPDQFGVFFHGDVQVAVPAGDGLRCAGGATVRLGLSQVDAMGEVGAAFDQLALPPGAELAPGDERLFQFWHRDGASFNFSDALRVSFRP